MLIGIYIPPQEVTHGDGMEIKVIQKEIVKEGSIMLW